MHPINIFETPLWIIEKKLPQGIHQWALDFKREFTCGTRRSNRGGYQSESYNALDNFPFEYQDDIKDTLKELPAFYFNNWWLNINYKGNYNVVHTHPNSDLSIIWNITDNYELLNFRSPHAHTRWGLWKASGYEIERSINAKAGTVIIFPADLVHYVLPHELESPRITISMNLSLKLD